MGSPCTFTHVLMDEAGQALLPEALIPLALLAPPPAAVAAGTTQTASWGAVLCGDPRQLGPVVRSQVAAASGLAQSLLEACITHHSATALDVLRMGRVPGTTTLVRNYRSHRRLLDLPSKMFYQGSLLAAADPRSVLPPRWRELAAEPDGDAWQEDSTSGAAGPAEPAKQPGGFDAKQEETPGRQQAASSRVEPEPEAGQICQEASRQLAAAVIPSRQSQSMGMVMGTEGAAAAQVETWAAAAARQLLTARQLAAPTATARLRPRGRLKKRLTADLTTPRLPACCSMACGGSR